MKKSTKCAVLTTSAILLALGSMMTSMAAEKGTWRLEGNEWYCYDADGDTIDNAFCLSAGKEFYAGDDGELVRSSWVEYEDHWYYVNSAGEKVVNEWRYLTPAEDEDGEESWYYFQSNGKRAESKKLVIKNETYYFDSEGKMLTGWIQGSGDSWENTENNDLLNNDIFFCGDDGARLNSEWIKTYGPAIDEDDADTDDQRWYYIKSTGKAAVGKVNDINGNTYIFNTAGEMLSGWVAGSGDLYTEIWKEDQAGTELNEVVSAGAEVYFCGDAEDGHVKKNRWIKEWDSVNYGFQDDDIDTHWFYITKSGKVYVPDTSTDSNAELSVVETMTLADVNADPDEMFTKDEDHDALEKKIGNDRYLFNQDGKMLYGFVLTDNGMFYYGEENDGSRKEGSVTVHDEEGYDAKAYFSKITNETEQYYDGAGVNGAYGGKLYANGILVKAQDEKYELKEVDGMKFIVNKNGSIQDEAGPYKDGGEILFGGATFTYFEENEGASHNCIDEIK